MRLLSNRSLGFSTLLAVVAFVPGCGGGSGGSGDGGDRTMQFGPLTTRVAGTVQPPVTSTGYGAAVTGVAGGNITAMTLQDTSPTLAETYITFAGDRDGNSEIYTMNADGSGLNRLTENGVTDYLPSRSSDGTKIAFTSTRDGNFEIYTMNADGSSQTRLTNHMEGDFAPSWSPDGTKIAFASDRDGDFEIYTMNADGSGPTRLTDNASFDADPSWSPDGTKIAFTSLRDGNREVYAMYADGSGQARLTNNTSHDEYPAWGARMARRTLVGAGGSMGANAAGFVFGRAGDEVRSMVVFDAAGRNSARVKAQTGTSEIGPNLVFNISADSINRLAYINFLDSNIVTTLVGPGTAVAAATDALVDFNSSTGRVSSILPYTANRSGAPTFTAEKGARVVRGRFLGAWDGKGVNRAPNGATEVRLDAKSGEIVGVK